MTETQNKKINQIARYDGRDKFVEVLTSSFELDRIILKFWTYNPNNASGSKLDNQIPIFLDFGKALAFADNILSGSYDRAFAYIEKANSGQAVDQKRLKDAWEATNIAMGGTSAGSLYAQGRPRPDGKSESRVLKLTQGNAGYLLRAEKGPGNETNTGLIAPEKQTDIVISIPMTRKSITEFANIIKVHIYSYMTIKHMRGVYAYNNDEVDFGNNGDGRNAQQGTLPPQQPNGYQPQPNAQQPFGQQPSTPQTISQPSRIGQNPPIQPQATYAQPSAQPQAPATPAQTPPNYGYQPVGQQPIGQQPNGGQPVEQQQTVNQPATPPNSFGATPTYQEQGDFRVPNGLSNPSPVGTPSTPQSAFATPTQQTPAPNSPQAYGQPQQPAHAAPSTPQQAPAAPQQQPQSSNFPPGLDPSHIDDMLPF